MQFTLTKKMGVAAYETGSGFSGWTTEANDENVNPLFKQIKKFMDEGKTSVLAWDTSLDSRPAEKHNELVWQLFSPKADVDEFISEHKKIIKENSK